MYTSDSFEGCGKMSESVERKYRLKSRRRLIIIGVLTFLLLLLLLLLLIIIGSVVGVVLHKHDGKSDDKPSTMASSIKAACHATLYPDSCYSSISSVGDATDINPKHIFNLSLKVAIEAISNVTSLPDSLSNSASDRTIQGALRDCKELLYDAMNQLNESIKLLNLSPGEKLLNPSKINMLRSWLSATITNQVTCLDGLQNTTSHIEKAMAEAMVNSTQYTSNSLAIATKILSHLQDFGMLISRKLLTTTSTPSVFPHWVSNARRRVLLQDLRRLTPNVTVAKDGSGQFKTINEALEVAPKKSERIFVIYIKEGVYDEIVRLDENKWNVVVYGDGMYKTIVTGRLNSVDGLRTIATATFAVVGKNFMARDMGFENRAGPQKNQAVALLSKSDFSLFYRCSFMGFQDTLYTHSGHQFYRDCDIVGTIDFIFGDAAVVFQNCNILPRQPLPNQKNTITAQGRTNPNSNTGISIQGCNIAPYDKVTAPTYLGRPWRDHATTVVMQSHIGEIVTGEGWLEWIDGVVPPKTIYYAEYMNIGPGASLEKRVSWPGYRSEISRSEAGNFDVETLILGLEWLPKTGVEFVGSV